MKQAMFFIGSPPIFGVLLLLVAHLDLYLFRQGRITAKQAIAHEAVFFLLGLTAVAIVLGLSLKYLLAREWQLSLLGLASMISFWICLAMAGEHGAAILNAT